MTATVKKLGHVVELHSSLYTTSVRTTSVLPVRTVRPIGNPSGGTAKRSASRGLDYRDPIMWVSGEAQRKASLLTGRATQVGCSG